MKKNYFLIVFGLCFGTILAQDNCATASPITSAGVYNISAVNGTELPQVTCTYTNTSTTAAEWYAYTPSEDFIVTVTSDLVENICLDTRLRIYSGTCAALTCVVADDDSGTISCTTNSNTYLSRASFNAVAGTTYYIVWDNRWASTGFNFQISEIPAGYNPCAAATAITAGTTTVNAIDQTNINTACSSTTLSKWYSYTPSTNAMVTVSSDLITNICKDTNFSVYTGNCTTGLTCITNDDNSGIIACNSGNTNSNLSVKTFEVAAGVTYYIVWDNKWSATGFDFTITEVPIIIPITYTTESISTINSSYNICVVDMNGDFKDDIVGISAANMRIHYQANTPGTYTITDHPLTGSVLLPYWSMAAGDYNKDGYNDIVLGNGSGATILTSNSNGTAFTTYTPGQYIFSQRTNFSDLNNDGNLDIFVCHDIAPSCYYLNNGNGNLSFYQSTVTAGSMSIATSTGNYATLFTDFDNDGDSDVFVSKCSGPPCELYRYDGNNIYTNISAIAGINVTPIQTWSSAIADFDNDGDMDIIITASASLHKYFRNNLDTTNTTEEAFSNITLGSGWDTNTSTNIDNIAYDFDNDGFVDVLGGGSKIMFNQGNSTFSPINYTGISVGAVGDLNNDGFLDIQNGTTIRYAVPNGNNWIKFSLQGIQSNSNGIGARVEIYGTWGKQIRDIRSGEGFRYMSSLNAHFGIGTANSISQVIIRWPSGLVDVINNPSINQSLHIIEGSSPLSLVDNGNSQIILHPNPSSEIITLANIEMLNIKNISIISTLGKEIKKVKLSNSSFSVSDLSEGLYILLIETLEGKKYSESFIKKN
ncbi:MAG: FG-GAP-like repeat-containing protein [Flavobacterium sp.]|uniref:FG-GAP-like repeat-containing protein n=1 Tax=Flavobacterium sp. TaxID=239 RepID=UPI001B494A0E|nr:FG-GAP-like repeat-containing protein [Flavobacterium sp.]MBP9849871.1 VCBS repeat-containing protein [Flavobacterium sp.]WRH73156.1 MAG: FG-GAP-like repeat-containing protein [Flavobacterium sp.]